MIVVFKMRVPGGVSGNVEHRDWPSDMPLPSAGDAVVFGGNTWLVERREYTYWGDTKSWCMAIIMRPYVASDDNKGRAGAR